MSAQGAKTAVQGGDVKEEVKQDMLDGYTKKQKRMILLQEKLKQRNRVVMVSKKQVLCSPDPKWPRIDNILTMKQLGEVNGYKLFTFVKSDEYHSLQKEFNRVQATCDI